LAALRADPIANYTLPSVIFSFFAFFGFVRGSLPILWKKAGLIISGEEIKPRNTRKHAKKEE
jgi:hypothetical protein